MNKKKVYIEVSGGLVQNVYTDADLDVDVIVCDRDSALQEMYDGKSEFLSTKACDELDKIKKNNKYKLVW